jgi:hypothetical protein
MPIYDVENRFSYYKSYSDNILVGSPRPSIGSTTWNRTVSGSVVSGSEEWKTTKIYSDYLYQKSNPYFRSGEVRYLRLASSNQTIKDSIVPNIVSLFALGGGKIVNDSSAQLFFALDGKPITASDGTRVNNLEWLLSMPFEKKYSYLTNDIDGYGALTHIQYELDYSTVTTHLIVPHDYLPQFLPGQFIAASFTKVGSTNILYRYSAGEGGTVDPVTGIFNNVGDFTGNQRMLYVNVFGFRKTYPVCITGTALKAAGSYQITGSSGYTLEGWKYGLYNGVPTNFSCVFRQNHYGQFRDMLEQRIYTQTYNNPKVGGPLDAKGGISFISGSALSGESNNYLTASIYQGIDVSAAYAVNPYGSGIFDRLYRASQPWHDDDPRMGT